MIRKAEKAESLLKNFGVKPTSNRILVAAQLLDSTKPLRLAEIVTKVDTIEKSSIFRVLSLLQDHNMIHAVEDGKGIVHYELCGGRGLHSVADMHAHFYCEKCGNVMCIEGIKIPEIAAPDGCEVRSVNYMLKGLCPDCLRFRR